MSEKKKKGWKAVGIVGLAVAGAAVGGLIGMNWDAMTAGGVAGLVDAVKVYAAEKVGPNVLLVIMSCAGLLTAASPAWAKMLGKVTTAVSELMSATNGVLGTDANGKRLLADFAEQSAERLLKDAENDEKLEKLQADYDALSVRFDKYIRTAESRETSILDKQDWLLRMMAEQAKGSGELVRNGTARHIGAMSETARKEDGHERAVANGNESDGGEAREEEEEPDEAVR